MLRKSWLVRLWKELVLEELWVAVWLALDAALTGDVDMAGFLVPGVPKW
jgi:hypothetical protein